MVSRFERENGSHQFRLNDQFSSLGGAYIIIIVGEKVAKATPIGCCTGQLLVWIVRSWRIVDGQETCRTNL